MIVWLLSISSRFQSAHMELSSWLGILMTVGKIVIDRDWSLWLCPFPVSFNGIQIEYRRDVNWMMIAIKLINNFADQLQYSYLIESK